jgi:glycosyltransferase involved in cell wall biosynthesis
MVEHLLLVIGAASGGGTERQFLLLARELMGLGKRVTLATLNEHSSPELAALVEGGLRWEVLAGAEFSRLRGRPIRRLAALRRAVRRLRHVLEDLRPDCTYSALQLPNLISALAWSGARSGRLVWGLRAVEEPPGLLSSGLSRALAQLSPRVDLVIANAEPALDRVRDLGWRPAATAVVANGIDADRFRPDQVLQAQARKEWGLGPSARAVACVARLTPEKDHPNLLRAVAALRDPRVVLVLAGAAPAVARRRLETLSTSLGLAGRVRWLGRIEAVSKVYNGADVHALSSRAEGFPNAVGEAMACACACVSTDVGATRLLSGEAARVVPAGRPEAMAEQIRILLEDDGARRQLGQAARQRVLGSFSPAALAVNTLAAIEGMPATGAGSLR